MKIIRKQFNQESELIDCIVLKSYATREDFNNLQSKMWQKVDYDYCGKPKLTNWKNKSIITTKTGHKFQFELKK